MDEEMNKDYLEFMANKLKQVVYYGRKHSVHSEDSQSQ